MQRPDSVVLTHVTSGFVAGETTWMSLGSSLSVRERVGAVDNDLSGRCS